ncbi:MAG: O-antigen/teichoic acid export membrane protein [Candidatus Azotimanducaceae bacterium]|jgi:O-antigen/teichoic acid export membrane protein
MLRSKIIRRKLFVSILSRRDLLNIRAVIYGDFLGQGLNYAVNIYIAVHFGALIFGTISYAIALASYMSVLTSLGIPSILARDIVQKPEEISRLVSTSLGLRLIIAVSLNFMLVLTLTQLSLGSLEYYCLILMSFSASLNIFNLDQSYDAMGRSSAHAKIKFFSQNLLYLVLIVLSSILSNADNVLYFLFSLLIANIAFAIANMLYFSRNLAPINFSICIATAKPLVKDSLIFLIAAGLNVLYLNFAVVFLRNEHGLIVVSSYGAASRVILILLMLDMVIMRVIVPKIAQLRSAASNMHLVTLIQILGIRVAYAAPLVAILFIYPGEVLDLLYQGEYASSKYLLQILSIWFLGGVANHFGTYIYTSGYLRSFLGWICLKIVLFLALLFLLYNAEIPAETVAIAFATTEWISGFLVVIASAHFARRNSGL